MVNVKRYIWTTFQKSGIHCYPEAGMDASLEKVSYLASPHRHIFHFKVQISVEHDNRSIEFILFKEWLESLYTLNTLQLDYKSCEMMCDDLYELIKVKYPNHNVIIDISEDGENGARGEYMDV